jgi:RNA polymerase sigma-70 factor (ECF subfamily)
VRLKFEEEQSYSDISKQLEMRIGNVGYRLHHILKNLAIGLRSRGVDGW